MIKKQIIIDTLFLTSILFIFYLTMFPNVYLGTGIAEGGHNFTPFLMMREIFTNGSLFSFVVNNIGNIVMFIPFGCLYPLAFPKRESFISVLLTGAFFSFSIETIQWFMKNRWSDIDDLILNTLGTIIGYTCYRGITRLKEKITIFI